MLQQAKVEGDWQDLKQRELRPPRRQRGDDIFAGSAVLEKQEFFGKSVPAYRLSVAPEGRSVPASAAVIAGGQWQPAAGETLPLSIQWQQSLPGTFDLWFELPAGARCLGLGERYSGLNLRGGVHTLSTTDETKHTEFADSLYKAIPFMVIEHGGACWGIFLDSPAPQRWHLDEDLNGKCEIELFTRLGWQLYAFGPAPLPRVLELYTELTGRVAPPPLWSLGHQQCRWSYATEEAVLNIAHEMRARKIPCDTIVLDIDYMDGYRVFTYSRERFPNFETLAQTLSAQNFKLVTIVDPGIKRDPAYPIYKQTSAAGLVCRTADGKEFVEEVWPGECVFPDF